jgi:hypothetical protein
LLRSENPAAVNISSKTVVCVMYLFATIHLWLAEIRVSCSCEYCLKDSGLCYVQYLRVTIHLWLVEIRVSCSCEYFLKDSGLCYVQYLRVTIHLWLVEIRDPCSCEYFLQGCGLCYVIMCNNSPVTCWDQWFMQLWIFPFLLFSVWLWACLAETCSQQNIHLLFSLYEYL